MKQTKKITRNQRELLKRNGVSDPYDYRLSKETKTEYIFYNEKFGTELRIGK